MNKYKEFKKYRGEKISSFPKMFALTKKQFEEGLQRLGVTEEEITSIGMCGFILKKDEKKFNALINDLELKLKSFIEKDDEFVVQMFEYEMGNFEYYISGDDEEVLLACGLSLESLKDDRLSRLYEDAKKKYMVYMEGIE